MKLLSISIAIIIAIFCVEPISSWKTFWKGRKFNGNLNQILQNHQNTGELPAEEWFENILDHNDLTNNATWKQVSHFYCASSLSFTQLTFHF
jgi:hypothetical protein